LTRVDVPSDAGAGRAIADAVGAERATEAQATEHGSVWSSAGQDIRLSALWFALFAQWLTVMPVILPDQVATIVGTGATAKEGAIGTIAAAGAFVALVVAPLAGALSDRTSSERGRRRPFLIAGTIGSCVSLGLLIPFGQGSSLILYGLAILNLQFWWNWVAGAYAGLIPDVVSEPRQSSASGWLNVMTILGTIVGNLLVAATYSSGQAGLTIAFFVTTTLVCLWFTLSVKEKPSVGDPSTFALRQFARSFLLRPSAHPNFYWVLVTRLLSNMGLWSVLTFLLSYLGGVIGVAHPDKVLPMLLGGGALLAIPASLWGIRLADRYGTVEVVKATSWIMAAAVTGYALMALRPDLYLVAPLVLIFAAASGAYQAVDWALALKVLPSRDNAGKDMGIWHIAMVLPQIIGPFGTGWIISGARQLVSVSFGYIVAFSLAAIWFTLAALFVGRVKLTASS
jgi:MFS family permease